MKIIAECGVNWSTIEEAKLMIDKCKEIRLDYAKFQLFTEEQIKNSDIYDELKKRILIYEDAKELFNYGKKIGQKVFFTPMFEEAVDLCEDIGVDLYKIRYKDRYNVSLIKKVLNIERRTIMSIDRQYIRPRLVIDNIDWIRFLLCIPKYPALPKDYGLSKDTFRLFSGISDHTKETELLLQTREFGARYFEKHVMLDGTHPLEEDWSISFGELKKAIET